MADNTKKNPWLKRILLLIILAIVVLGIVYWFVSTEKFSDTKKEASVYTINALDFIREFQQNDSAANKKYTEKIITINGTISELEASDTSAVNVKFVDSTTGSFIIFAFQDEHRAEARNLKAGDNVSIKGSCSGGVYSEILGATKIDFQRAALNK